MKKTVEDMKRRRSVGPPSNANSALDEDMIVDVSENDESETIEERMTIQQQSGQGVADFSEEGSDKENEGAFSLQHDCSDQYLDSEEPRSADNDSDIANSDKEQENVTVGAFSGTSSLSVEGC
ncbi:hypothetical protein SERLADRAFT_403608, partial [Serpula lacrymans var. lacrymans S7.9]